MNLKIDKTWSLFLDRDGVINERIPDDYVKSVSEFRFTEGALDALALFAVHFGRVFVVTNQSGISKGKLSENDVAQVHQYFLQQTRAHGGRIDKIYHAPDYSDWRKPETGMGLQAQLDFPEIDFKKAIMVGDSSSDMDFGRRLGMVCVFIEGKGDDPSVFQPDFRFKSLAGLADTVFKP